MAEAFTQDDFMDLMPAIYTIDDGSKDEIARFLAEKCASRSGFMQLLIVLAEMCASVSRLLSPDPIEFTELQVSEATPANAVTFGQIIAVTMNGDGDTQVALIRAMLDRAEATEDVREVSFVAVECFALFSFLLHELTDRKPSNAEHPGGTE